MNCYLNELGIINALGNDRASVYEGLISADRSGMRLTDSYRPGRPCIVGKVNVELPEIPTGFDAYQSRNNRLILAALMQIEDKVRGMIERFGPQRIGIVLGTSTSGIEEGELALIYQKQGGKLPQTYHFCQQRLYNGAEFLAHYLGISGPSMVISTACSSSANALASARRLIRLDLCDAVLVGGGDSLCRMTVQGFSALEAVSDELCNPMSVNRKGINIGEGAAFFLLSREPAPIALLGVGSSSDAHHISAPEPKGLGAIAAMHKALADAQLDEKAVDYVNLHGTATKRNAEMESRAMQAVFPGKVACSSTKPLTGHTLGAAGATEVALCWLLLSDLNRDNRLAPHCWDAAADPALPVISLVGETDSFAQGPEVCMSNSYAFGGNNVSVVIGRNNG